MVQTKTRIPLVKQGGFIKNTFPNGKLIKNRDRELLWEGDIIPSPNSATYTIKVHYTIANGVRVYVTNPKPLVLAEGKNKLPHVYSHENQQLCLYYPKGFEWSNSVLLVDTIFPWTSEWLLHYELWVITGEWHGGGKHPNKNKEKVNETK